MYEAKTFNIPSLDGISEQTIEEHLKLYEGYVKHVNKISELMMEPSKHDEYALKEARRRLAFEFDGMRNHEYYFSSFEDKANELPSDSSLYRAFEPLGGFEAWLENFKKYLVTTRGVGWAMLGYDTQAERLVSYWVDEQHLGHLTGIQPIVALDMWEHSYCLDYPPSKKGEYIEAFFRNLNWQKPLEWFEQAQK
jgi:Fe-Mn family superoxide dismutase